MKDNKQLEKDLRASIARMRASTRRLKRVVDKMKDYDFPQDPPDADEIRPKNRLRERRRHMEEDREQRRQSLKRAAEEAKAEEPGSGWIQALALAGLFFKTMFAKPTKPAPKK